MYPHARVMRAFRESIATLYRFATLDGSHTRTSPEGAKQLSPALQRWVEWEMEPSPVGTAEVGDMPGLKLGMAQVSRGCLRTVPSPKGLGFISHLPSTPPSAPCWAKLSRAYGAGFSASIFPWRMPKLRSRTSSQRMHCPSSAFLFSMRMKPPIQSEFSHTI